MTELTIDLDTYSAMAQLDQLELQIDAPMPGIEIGIPGIQGPIGLTGPTGIVRVNHGADDSVARPAGAAIVLWVGSVVPLNWNISTDLIAYTNL